MDNIIYPKKTEFPVNSFHPGAIVEHDQCIWMVMHNSDFNEDILCDEEVPLLNLAIGRIKNVHDDTRVKSYPSATLILEPK